LSSPESLIPFTQQPLPQRHEPYFPLCAPPCYFFLSPTLPCYDKEVMASQLFACLYQPHDFPFPLLRKSWQYHLLTNIKKAIPATPENSKLIDDMFKQYPKGFYVHAKDTVDNRKGMVRYIGRYIRHLTIAESRMGKQSSSITWTTMM